jgi:hypothetical protein
MKTFFVTIAFLVILSVSALAQFEKGTWIGGVNGNLNVTGRSSGTQLISWSFNPYAMYLVSKNLAVGIVMDNGFTHYRGEYQIGTETNSQKGFNYSLQLAPTVRKYFGNGMFRPFVGLTTGLSLFHSRGYSSYEDSKTKETEFNYVLAPEAGVSWWLNEKVFLDIKASYNLIDSYYSNGYHTFDIKIGVGFKIGK